MQARVFLIAGQRDIASTASVIQCHYNLGQLQSCLEDWDVDVIQLGPAESATGACSAASQSMHVVRVQLGVAAVIRGTASPVKNCLILSSNRSAPLRWLGQSIDGHRFAAAGRGARIDLFVPANATFCVIKSDSIAGLAKSSMQLRSASSEYMAELLTTANLALNPKRASDHLCIPDEIATALDHAIRFVVDRSEALMTNASARNLRAWAAARACRYIDARIARPISLATLSKYCGVSIRTLEYSFRQFYDTTPITFIKSQRLTQTHNDLIQSKGRATTISQIARRAGFTHMGQYCQDYRAMFGESPSMTLQRSLREFTTATSHHRLEF